MKNLCVIEKYTSGGEDKVRWNKIGILFEAKGKEYIKLYHMPNVLISVFEQQKKEESSNDPQWLDGEE